jgi:hypothetical protein
MTWIEPIVGAGDCWRTVSTFSTSRWHKPNLPFSFEQEIANENNRCQGRAREILQTTIRLRLSSCQDGEASLRGDNDPVATVA